jgi:hypothetical protein
MPKTVPELEKAILRNKETLDHYEQDYSKFEEAKRENI